MPVLRPYQQDLQDRMFERWRVGDRNVLVTLATGGGKSLIVSDTVRKFALQGKTVLVQAHRKELVQQMSVHVARQSIPHRIIGSKETVVSCTADQRRDLNGKSFVNPSAQVAIASVDTVMARMDQLRPWLKTVDLIVTDEAHHVAITGNHGPNRQPNKWAAVFDECVNAYGLGVTATAQRADGKGLGRHTDGVFDSICLGPGTADLIGIKALTEFECYCPEGDFSLENLKQGVDGDYTQASMKAASEASRIVGDVVEHYMRYASGKRAVVFATDVATSGRMADQFNAAGIPSASISGMTDPAVRSDVLRRLRDGRIKVVCNCELISEGLDIPSIDACLLARPTASLAVYLQQVGRCLRPDPDNPGKVATIIDMVSNIKRHGFPDQRRSWSLERRDKRAAKAKDPELLDVYVCPETGRPAEMIHIAACIHCGGNHTRPTGEGTVRMIEQIAGDLTKLSAADLAILRAATQLPTPDEAAERGMFAGGPGAAIGQRNAAYARLQARDELSEAIALWRGYQHGHYGRSESDSYRRFYQATGLDVASALAGSRSDMVALTARVNSWITNS